MTFDLISKGRLRVNRICVRKWFLIFNAPANFNHFRRLPPGPWSFPFLGIFYKINSERPHLTYTEWNKKYGDVVSFTIFGTQRVVIVSSEEAIREILIHKQDQFSGTTFRTLNWTLHKQEDKWTSFVSLLKQCAIPHEKKIKKILIYGHLIWTNIYSL